jgi:hypothetical protein
MFRNSVIKNLRKDLIDREYLKEQRLCRGPDYRRWSTPKTKAYKPPRGYERQNNNETLEWQ